MNMHRLSHKSLLLWLLVLSASLAATAQAEDYPTRPVKIISDSAPGSAVDVTLRMVADRLGHIWGQQVLPVNQPGAGGTISARAAADSAPDGYTLYMPALSVFLPAPGKAANLVFDVPRDFAPIGSVTEQPMFIAAAPSLGVTTLPELIALAKQRPGEISYAVTGVGRLTHLTGELLQLRTGIKLLLVPYSGGPSHSLNDIMGGRIPLIIEGYQGLAGALQGANLKPLASAAAERLSDVPRRSDRVHSRSATTVGPSAAAARCQAIASHRRSRPWPMVRSRRPVDGETYRRVPGPRIAFRGFFPETYGRDRWAAGPPRTRK